MKRAIKFRGKRPDGSWNYGRGILFKGDGSVLIHGAYFALSHQWISVEESLPELMERVLVAYRLTGRHTFRPT